MFKKIILIFTCLISFSGLFFHQNVSAKVYKWVDSQGKIQYSSTPPKNQRTKEVKITPFDNKKARRKRITYSQIQADKAEDKALAEKKKKGDDDPAVTAAKKRNAAIKKRNCANAKRTYRQMKGAFKNKLLAKKDANGNMTLMDTNDVKRQKQRAAAKMRRFCR